MELILLYDARFKSEKSNLLLMAEILHHLKCIKTRRKEWDKLPVPQLASRISEPSTVCLAL